MASAKTAYEVARNNSRRTRTVWCMIEVSPDRYDAVEESKLPGGVRVWARYRSGRRLQD